MSFLSRLFGRRSSGAPGGDLEKRLEKLEAEAETAAPGYVGTAYNRAGDVALRGGETGRAVAYYGRAIDAFLNDGQREAARGVANKIIRVRPAAVRTLCTLTWLDLAARHSATALLHLRDYVDAAKGIDRTGIAASQIYDMARLVPEPEFIGAVADALDVLDYSNLGREVRGWVQAGGSPEAIHDGPELAAACLRAAVKSNERGERSMVPDGPAPPDDEAEPEGGDSDGADSDAPPEDENAAAMLAAAAAIAEEAEPAPVASEAEQPGKKKKKKNDS